MQPLQSKREPQERFLFTNRKRNINTRQSVQCKMCVYILAFCSRVHIIPEFGRVDGPVDSVSQTSQLTMTQCLSSGLIGIQVTQPQLPHTHLQQVNMNSLRLTRDKAQHVLLHLKHSQNNINIFDDGMVVKFNVLLCFLTQTQPTLI